MENPEYSEARVEPPAAIADPVVYDFLSRAVVRGERIDDVFRTGDPAVLAVRITAAMLVASCRAGLGKGTLSCPVGEPAAQLEGFPR